MKKISINGSLISMIDLLTCFLQTAKV